MIATAVCTVGGFTACNDLLEPTPQSSWDIDGFYQNETQVELAYGGIYNQLANNDIYGSQIMRFDSGTDESYYNRRYNDNWPVGLNKMTASSKYIKGFWVKLYTCIDYCNIFENKVSGSSAFDESTKERYLAEVRFLRGLAFFNLAQWFGPVPVPLEYTKDTNSNDLAPSPLEEVYAQIVADLSYGAEGNRLPSLDSSDYMPGRASKQAAQGLLARVYMHMAGEPLKDASKYQLALNLCDSIMSNGYNDLVDATAQEQAVDELGELVFDENNAPVMTTVHTGYREMFLNYIQNRYETKESIFEISYSYLRDKGLTTDGGWGCLNGVAFSYNSAVSTGYPTAYAMMNATPVLYDTYDSKDKRRDWNIPLFSYSRDGDAMRVTNAMSTSYNPGKYRRWEPTDMTDLDVNLTATEKANGVIEPYTVLEANPVLSKNFSAVNFPILRFSDILLMYAEASNEVNMGPNAEAIAALNRVRLRASLDPIETAKPEAVASHDAFLSELQDERLRELCFEGLRRQDLIRWGIYQSRLEFLAGQVQGDPNFKEGDAQCESFLRAYRYFEEKDLSLPYPDQEVKLNKLLNQKAEWMN